MKREIIRSPKLFGNVARCWMLGMVCLLGCSPEQGGGPGKDPGETTGNSQTQPAVQPDDAEQVSRIEKMGGEVVYFGKPFPEVYNQSVVNNERNVLAIGDNLNTDIKGANNMNYDSMIIINGIHKEEINNEGIDKVSKKYKTTVNFMQSELKW